MNRIRAVTCILILIALSTGTFAEGPYFFCGPFQSNWTGRSCVVWYWQGQSVGTSVAAWVGRGIVRFDSGCYRVDRSNRVEGKLETKVLTVTSWESTGGEYTVAWENPENAALHDTSRTTAALTGIESALLTGNIEPAGLPAGAFIERIAVELECSGSVEGAVTLAGLSLENGNGDVSGITETPAFPTVEQYFTFSDWAPIPSLEELNGEGLKISLLAWLTDSEVDATASINHLRITVYYEEDSDMSVTVPALSGSESVVGITREATWGTTPVTGADPNKTISNIVFFPIKEENIQAGFNAEPQRDDMSGNREVSRIIENGSMNEGSLRLIPGPETLGYFLTMMFGTPETTTKAASAGTNEGAYEHTWYPGQRDRDEWPTWWSIESIFAAVRSKLVRGAILRRLPMEIPNNGPMTCSPEFIAKNIIWLDTASGSLNSLGETKPAKMTASPTLLEETAWHFKQLELPELDDTDEYQLTSVSFEPAFTGLEGIFTGGSGLDLGTYRVDNFELSGRATVLFADETYWEKFKAGDYFKFKASLTGDLIQGSTYNSLEIIAYSCKANANANVNRVGELAYDFSWSGRKDPVQGHSCQITLVNTVASYALPA